MQNGVIWPRNVWPNTNRAFVRPFHLTRFSNAFRWIELIPIIEIDSDARAEIQNAADFYDRLRPNLGTRFEADIMRTRDRILTNSLMYAEEDGGYRYAILDHFPYSLIYKLYDDRILVVAIAHHKQRPGYWHDRIRR